MQQAVFDRLAPGGPQRRKVRLIDGDISIELAPDETKGFQPDRAVFREGSQVFLTHIAGRPLAAQVDAARRLAGLGYRPVPHLGARNFSSAAEYASHVAALASGGVTAALFVGGNPLAAHGPLYEAAELLAHPVLAATAIRVAYLGAHPEGHPSIEVMALEEALRRKLAFCLERGLSPAVVTQFGFDGTVISNWARGFATMHPDVPLRLGVAGVTSLPKLIGYAVRCGVGPSLAALRRAPAGLFGLVSERDPGDVVEAIEAAGAGMRSDLHVFAFGGWRKTLDWIAARRMAMPPS